MAVVTPRRLGDTPQKPLRRPYSLFIEQWGKNYLHSGANFGGTFMTRMEAQF